MQRLYPLQIYLSRTRIDGQPRTAPEPRDRLQRRRTAAHGKDGTRARPLDVALLAALLLVPAISTAGQSASRRAACDRSCLTGVGWGLVVSPEGIEL